MSVEDRLGELRDAASRAQMELRTAVEEACPGEHAAVQHRDGRPPWCRVCGRTDDGQIAHRTAPQSEGSTS